MTRRDVVFIGMVMTAIGLLVGYVGGAKRHYGKDAVMEQFQSWELQEQQDFILAAVSDKAKLRREIAEDWCAINKQTQRVCWNAKMNHPIRGVK